MFHKLINNWPIFCKKQVIANIIREWKKFAQKILPTKIFYDEQMILGSEMTTGNRHDKYSSIQFLDHQNFDPIFVKKTLDFYSTNLSQWFDQSHSSFGVLYLHSFDNQHASETHLDLKFLNEDYINRGISLILFCHKNETLKIQQMLTRTRYHWFRRLSKSPLNSGFRTSLNETENIFKISYEAKQSAQPNNKIILDHIILDQSLYNEIPKTRIKQDVDVIVCKSDLKNCFLAFSDDSFSLVGKDQRIVMKLSPQLVPFKLAITFETSSPSSSSKCWKKLNEVAEHLIDLLQEHQEMTIFPFIPNNLITIEQCDRLAIKYCIILKEETLKNGVIYLRNRDTLLTEMVHISNLLKTLLFYIQPEKLITFETNDEKIQLKKDMKNSPNKKKI